MNDPVYQRLREIAWRRKLTEAEEVELRAWLAAHPEAAAECEVELALSDALAKLPDASMPTNFAARVLREIEREEMRPASQRDWRWFWRSLVPRTAVAMLVIGGSFAGYHQYRDHQRKAVGKSLLAVAEVKSMPTTDVLMNFDAIQKLNTESVADQELLALFK
jgi:anti-sigma factor RsiW